MTKKDPDESVHDEQSGANKNASGTAETTHAEKAQETNAAGSTEPESKNPEDVPVKRKRIPSKNDATRPEAGEDIVSEGTEDEDTELPPVDYIYEPGKEEIVKELIPKSLKIQFYKAVLDSFVAEHGARMTAMHKATDNATEMIRDLTLQYNKARQAAITNQILEVVSGAEALKG